MGTGKKTTGAVPFDPTCQVFVVSTQCRLSMPAWSPGRPCLSGFFTANYSSPISIPTFEKEVTMQSPDLRGREGC